MNYNLGVHGVGGAPPFQQDPILHNASSMMNPHAEGFVHQPMVMRKSYGAQDQSYGTAEQSYGAIEQGYGASEHSYVTNDQDYGTHEPSYGTQHGYGPQHGYSGSELGYGALEHGYDVHDQGYGTHEQGYGVTEQGYGLSEQAYGVHDDSYGVNEHAYGAPEHGFGTAEHGYEASEQGYVDPEEELYPQEFMEIKNLMVDGGDRYGVSTVAFDGQEEMIWMGNTGGHMTSYYGPDLQKYTSFQAHDTEEVRQIMTADKRVFGLTRDSLLCLSKYGRRLHKHDSEHLVDMQCMMFTGPQTLLMGGHQTTVVEYDIEARRETRQIAVDEPGWAILRHSGRLLCAGDTSGKILLYDPSTLTKQHELKAHSGTLSDFDVHGNQLVTCGFSNRMGNLMVDRYLMMFDLRMMKAMSPLQMIMEPMFLKFIPTYSDRICVVSQSGQFQVVEQGALSGASMVMYQVQTEGAAITGMDVGMSNQVISLGDSGGFLHLFGSGENPVFNPYSQETEFPTVEHVPPTMSLTDPQTILSSIPMHYPTTGRLLSDWPPDLCRRVYRKPAGIDPEILHTMKMVHNVGYAPNPGTRRLNQIPYQLANSDSSYRSGSGSRTDHDDPFVQVPKHYRKVHIKYSKLGVEDFDFRLYNKTNFAGLETHIPNAYCNAALQVLYFLEPLRVTLLNHLCNREFCLSCELGFLFHMLDQQKGKTCQANNFLRAFRTIPEASALSLVLSDTEESMGKFNLPRLIQNWNRFILQQMHSELVDAEKYQDSGPLSPLPLSPTGSTKWNLSTSSDDSPHASPQGAGSGADKPVKDTSKIEVIDSGTAKASFIKSLFGSTIQNTFTCRCGRSFMRDMTASVTDLNYPDIKGKAKDLSDRKPRQEYTFAEVVQQSLCLDQPTQAWCTKCEKYQPHLQTKVVKCLPDVLSLNCHLENSRDYEFWQKQVEILESKKKETSNKASTPLRSRIKVCRYGIACNRPGCKFRHAEDGDKSDRDSSLDRSAAVDEGLNEVSWLPIGLHLHLNDAGKVEASNIEDEEKIPSEWDDKSSVYYEILAAISHIKDSKGGGNLVSKIKVAEKFHQRKERVTCTQWYLFNDFSITPIEKNEALSFNLAWNTPCVLFFARKDIHQKHNLPVQNPVNASLLLINSSLVSTPRRKNATFVPLAESELPQRNDIVGLDAEFVTLNQEEAELRSDGTRSMIKPSQMSVARVTCVRGKGLLWGEPFIDDYISTQEQVVDYLTQFSGIQPGDLDASISSKHLTTLKCTYLKLRYLIDCGVIFVGHGLKKDFRVINLVVPKGQVIDTVYLFHQPRQRMISLKFLAWHFLQINIQDGAHDSTEDSRTALKLYLKYQEMSREGLDHVRRKIREMYDKGRKLQWKITEPGFLEGEEGTSQSEEEPLSNR